MSKRQLKKMNRNQNITLTVEALDNLRRKASLEAVHITNYFPLLVLRDTFELGQTTLNRFQKSYVDIWDQYNHQKLNLTTIAKELKDVADITFAERKDLTHHYPEKAPSDKITIKKRDLDRIRKNSIHDAFMITGYIPLYVLRSEYGFGKVRLQRFHQAYLNLWDSYNKEYVSLQDIKDVLKDEVNVTWISDDDIEA